MNVAATCTAPSGQGTTEHRPVHQRDAGSLETFAAEPAAEPAAKPASSASIAIVRFRS